MSKPVGPLEVGRARPLRVRRSTSRHRARAVYVRTSSRAVSRPTRYQRPSRRNSPYGSTSRAPACARRGSCSRTSTRLRAATAAAQRARRSRPARSGSSSASRPADGRRGAAVGGGRDLGERVAQVVGEREARVGRASRRPRRRARRAPSAVSVDGGGERARVEAVRLDVSPLAHDLDRRARRRAGSPCRARTCARTRRRPAPRGSRGRRRGTPRPSRGRRAGEEQREVDESFGGVDHERTLPGRRHSESTRESRQRAWRRRESAWRKGTRRAGGFASRYIKRAFPALRGEEGRVAQLADEDSNGCARIPRVGENQRHAAAKADVRSPACAKRAAVVLWVRSATAEG